MIFVDSAIHFNRGELRGSVIRGMNAASNYLDGVKRDGYEPQAALEALSAEYREEIAATKKALRDVISGTRKDDVKRRKSVWRTALRWRRKFGQHLADQRDQFLSVRSDFDARCNSTHERFRNLENAYMELMRIKAPVDYWTDKAKSHLVAERTYRNILLKYSIGGSFLLIIALYLIYMQIERVSYSNTPAPTYFILSSIGLAISIILFWAGRILVRLFMSEQSLGCRCGGARDNGDDLSRAYP